MQTQNKICVTHKYILTRLAIGTLAHSLVFVVACSKSEAIELRVRSHSRGTDTVLQRDGEQSPKQQSSTTENPGDLKNPLALNGNSGFAGQSAKTLVYLSQLQSDASNRFQAVDFNSGTSSIKCGFIATDESFAKKVGSLAPGWTPSAQTNLFVRSPLGTQTTSFQECVCLVEALSAKENVYLIPTEVD